MKTDMNDEALSLLLKQAIDPGDVTARPETVSVVMRTVGIGECLRDLAELYLVAPHEVLTTALNGRGGRKEQ